MKNLHKMSNKNQTDHEFALHKAKLNTSLINLQKHKRFLNFILRIKKAENTGIF